MKCLHFDTFNGNNTTICLINTSYNTMTMLLWENKLFSYILLLLAATATTTIQESAFFGNYIFISFIVFCSWLCHCLMVGEKETILDQVFVFYFSFFIPFRLWKSVFSFHFIPVFFRKDSLTLLACQYNSDS
jgi:hypothetical protein